MSALVFWPIMALLALGVLVVIISYSFKVIKQYERGVAFRFGHLRPLMEPGGHWIIPVIDKMERVDQRVVTLTIPPQEIITKDNVSVRVNAVVMFEVTDSIKAVLQVENYAVATSQIAQTTLRSLLGRASLDDLLAHRDELNEDLRRIINGQTHRWGVETRIVEIKDVEIPELMQRALAREAEAERERRAKVISAHGELQSSKELREAAEELQKAPAALQLRYLQTILELGADQNSTVVFPLPIDILGGFMDNMGKFQQGFSDFNQNLSSLVGNKADESPTSDNDDSPAENNSDSGKQAGEFTSMDLRPETAEYKLDDGYGQDVDGDKNVDKNADKE